MGSGVMLKMQLRMFHIKPLGRLPSAGGDDGFMFGVQKKLPSSPSALIGDPATLKHRNKDTRFPTRAFVNDGSLLKNKRV